MSHTTTINDTTFIHDGDFGGDIEIRRTGDSMTIPFADLKGIVAEYVRRERIARLEQSDDDEVLGL